MDTKLYQETVRGLNAPVASNTGIRCGVESPLLSG